MLSLPFCDFLQPVNHFLSSCFPKLDFQHGILAVGCTNCAVELWVPDQEVDD